MVKRYILAVSFLLVITPAPAREVSQVLDGLVVTANLELAPGKSLKQGVVVIVHGLQAHNRMEIIEASQRALLDSGHNSLAINLGLGIDRRQGFFDCNWTHRHGFDAATDEIRAWVEWLRARNAGPISLLGHSLGGTQVLYYADKFPDTPVSRLVLLAPSTGGFARMQDDYRQRYNKDLDEVLTRAWGLVESGQDAEVMENTDFFYCPKTRVTASTFFDYYRRDSAFTRMPGYLKRLRMPVLIIAGSADERQPEVIAQLSPFADGERIRFVVIDNAGHFFRDLNIDEAIGAAIEFIDDS